MRRGAHARGPPPRGGGGAGDGLGGDADIGEILRMLGQPGMGSDDRTAELFAQLAGAGARRPNRGAEAVDAAGRVLRVGDPVRCRDRTDKGVGTDWQRGEVAQVVGGLKVRIGRKSYAWDDVEYIGGPPLREGVEPWVEGQGWAEDIPSDDGDSSSAAAAAAAPPPAGPMGAAGGEVFQCAGCRASLPAASFTGRQLRKKAQRKCKPCVERAEAMKA